MENTDRILDMAQDMASVQQWMLTVLHALETGVMPRSFIVFNDNTLYEYATSIQEELGKRGIILPD